MGENWLISRPAQLKIDEATIFIKLSIAAMNIADDPTSTIRHPLQIHIHQAEYSDSFTRPGSWALRAISFQKGLSSETAKVSQNI